VADLGQSLRHTKTRWVPALTFEDLMEITEELA